MTDLADPYFLCSSVRRILIVYPDVRPSFSYKKPTTRLSLSTHMQVSPHDATSGSWVMGSLCSLRFSTMPLDYSNGLGHCYSVVTSHYVVFMAMNQPCVSKWSLLWLAWLRFLSEIIRNPQWAAFPLSGLDYLLLMLFWLVRFNLYFVSPVEVHFLLNLEFWPYSTCKRYFTFWGSAVQRTYSTLPCS